MRYRRTLCFVDRTMQSSGQDPEVHVAWLRWPAARLERQKLIERGIPRVLIVAAGEEPPEDTDELEDWIREPVESADLLRRIEALRRRQASRAVPYLDEDGLLHYGDRWVVISDAQLPIVELLVRHFGRVVRTEDLAAAYAAGGQSRKLGSLRAVITRVRQRVSGLGLSVEAVRQRGIVLDRTPAESRTHGESSSS